MRIPCWPTRTPIWMQLTAGIGQTLDNLANITSNLNAQVQANSNMLGGISKTVMDTDDFVQG